MALRVRGFVCVICSGMLTAPLLVSTDDPFAKHIAATHRQPALVATGPCGAVRSATIAGPVGEKDACRPVAAPDKASGGDGARTRLDGQRR